MIFVSYTARDEEFADFFSDRLVSLGADVFRMSTSIRAGEQWMERLRRGLNTCDEAVGILSRKAHERPWIPAEWAAFWVRGHRYTPLLVGIGVDDLWEPMRASQAVSANAPGEIEDLLARLTQRDPEGYDADLVAAAREVATHPAVSVGMADQALARIVANLPYNTDNVDPDDVEMVVETGNVSDLLQATSGPNVGAVKLRQVAAALAVRHQWAAALEVIRTCGNLNERLNALRPLLDEVSAPLSQEERDFVLAVAALLRPPQLRGLRTALTNIGLDPDELLGVDAPRV